MVVVKPSGNPVISAPLTTDCILEWFAKWNPDQRSEFGKLLVSIIVRPPSSNHVNPASEEDLVDQVSQMKMGQHSESQSCFRSQLQIAGNWLRSISAEEKSAFLHQFGTAYPLFCHWIMTS